MFLEKNKIHFHIQIIINNNTFDISSPSINLYIIYFIIHFFKNLRRQG